MLINNKFINHKIEYKNVIKMSKVQKITKSSKLN